MQKVIFPDQLPGNHFHYNVLGGCRVILGALRGGWWVGGGGWEGGRNHRPSWGELAREACRVSSSNRFTIFDR